MNEANHQPEEDFGLQFNSSYVPTGKRSARPAGSPTWAKPMQAADWQRRGMVIWQNGTQRIVALSGIEAVHYLDRLRASSDWEQAGLSLTRQVHLIRKPGPGARADQESIEDRPQGWARALRIEEDLFYADREVLDRAGTSLPWYRKHLGVVMDWLEEQGIASCEVVTEADVQAFLKMAASRKSDPQGDLRDLDIAGQIFFDLMVSEEITAESPIMRIPRVQPQPGAFPVVEPEVVKQHPAAAGPAPALSKRAADRSNLGTPPASS